MPDTLPDIGLIGYAQAGKDTFAARLIEGYGYTKVAFADALRAMALAIDPVVGAVTTPYGDPVIIRYSKALEVHGYEETKARFPEARRFLQRLGTEGIRRHVRDSFWVDTALEQANRVAPAVFTDVRFPNEADAIRDRGGLLIRIHRPGNDAVNGHTSETALDSYEADAVVMNRGSVRDLHRYLDARVMPWVRSTLLPTSEEDSL